MKEYNDLYPILDPSFNSGLDYAEQLYINDKLKNWWKESTLKKILTWSISQENQELLKKLKVIDFHSHIWNILQRDITQIYDDTREFPVDIRTIWSNIWKFKAPWKIMNAIMHTKIVDDILKQSWKNRNSSATLKTFWKSLEESFIDKAVCLPIAPYQTYDDLNEASLHNNDIIAFSWIDFSKFYSRDKSYYEVLSDIENQFRLDVLNWSKWLKIHPIIQWISVDTNMVDDVVDLWTSVSKWLPIIFHTWVTEYCKKDENCSQHRPEYGQIKYFIKLAEKHKDANIVIWHSWLFQVDEVIDHLAIFENVSVDTSFQWEEKIKQLLFSFWVERLHFASDWPYWDRIPAVNVMLDTLSKVHSSLFSDERMKELIFRDNALRSMKLK